MPTGPTIAKQPHGPASIAALRDAVLKGREPPPAEIVARLPGYRWYVVATVCIGAFMGQVNSSIAQMLLPRLEHEFGAQLSTVSWVAIALECRSSRRSIRPGRCRHPGRSPRR